MSTGTSKSRLSREQAVAMLRGSWRETRLGQLRALIAFQLPYYLFEISVAGRRPSLFAIDAVSGELDLYQFDEMPEVRQVATAHRERKVSASLTVASAQQRLVDRILRMAFLQGFFKRRPGAIRAVYVGELPLPYWLGVFERRGLTNLEVIDAGRGRFEGAKMREIARQMLESNAGDTVALDIDNVVGSTL